MLLVNLYGPPGSGKSTGAAYIFSQLKMRGVNAELITEYAKEKVWEGAENVLKNQAYIFGKQFHYISRLEEKVDVAVTDSPLLLSTIYNQDKKRLGPEFDALVKRVDKSYMHRLDLLIKRTKPYNTKGRLQTEQESDALFFKIKELLDSSDICYTLISGEKERYDEIVNWIIKELGLER